MFELKYCGYLCSSFRLWSRRKTFELAKYPLRIKMIDLFENRIRQREPVDFPSALTRGIPIIEIFVVCFEPPKVITIHLRNRLGVRPEHYPILIILEEFQRTAGLAAKFCFAGTKLNEHVRIAIHPL